MPPPPGNDESNNQILSLLEKLRDHPADASQTSQDDLLVLHGRLMKVDPKEDGTLHWFCPQAASITRELASFLLRLHAYNNDKVNQWREKLRNVWRCSECVFSMDEVKKTSRTTYFGAFPDSIIQRFWVNFEEYEVKYIAESLEAYKSIADVPSHLVYHMLTKASSLANPTIVKLLSPQEPLTRAADWPMNPIPIGYLLLVMHENTNIRKWAIQHACNLEPVSAERLSPDCEVVSQIYLHKIGELEKLSNPQAQKIVSEFPFSQTCGWWSGFSFLLYYVPRSFIESKGLHRTVIKHLHDNSPDFLAILKSMALLLKSLKGDIWKGESVDYPQIVFDSIKDNPSYLNNILSQQLSEGNNWLLSIFSEFVLSLWDMQIFGDVLARVLAFFCVELQHERFGDKRPVAMNAATWLLKTTFMKAIEMKSSLHKRTISNVIDIHYDLIVSVAMSGDYLKPEWGKARLNALLLIREFLCDDASNLVYAYFQIMRMEHTSIPQELDGTSAVIRHQAWQKVYSNLSSKNAEGIPILFDLATRVAILDSLDTKTLSRAICEKRKDPKLALPKRLLDSIEPFVNNFNASMTTIHRGFLDCISKFTSYNTASTLLDITRRGELAKYHINLLLSPVEDLNTAAQTYIGQAFDVDVRSDCFREILKDDPAPSFSALFRYMEHFNSYAPTTYEACNFSKALVRCLTDVIEVLGSSSDGLIHKTDYMKKCMEKDIPLKKAIPKLWKIMTESISVIFKWTPKWSIYFSSVSMTEWMRDALIFARDLLNRRRSFETTTVSEQENQGVLLSPRKSSSDGKIMVDDLKNVLYELTAWLRLTNMELLYQSFELLKSILQCYREADLKLSPLVLSKLKKFVSSVQRSDEAKPVSYLNRSDLSELELVLADFEDKEEQENHERQILPASKKAKKTAVIDIGSSETSDSGAAEIENTKATKNFFKPVGEFAKRVSKSTTQTKLGFKKSAPEPELSRKVTTVKAVMPKSERSGPKFEGSKVARTKPVLSTSSAPDSNSDSSSESEDSDGNRGLAKLARLQRKREEALQRRESKKETAKKEVRRPIEKRKARLIEDPMLTAQNEARERMKKYEEARRTAMRLKPDITPLHRMILSWNYDHEGSLPPIKGRKPDFRNVPDTFVSHEEYFKTFQPLLMLECWAQIVKSKEESSPETYICKITSRCMVDDWIDLEVVIMDTTRPDWRVTPDVDIILLRHSTEKTSIMAKVLGIKKTPVQIEIGLRCCTSALDKDPGLFINSTWRLSSVFSLTTLHREFAALMALPYYDMADFILRPNLSDPVMASSSDIQQAMSSYQVNEPQAKAIISSMKTKGFTLIQGPPGTGKTWTICGLVGAFLSSRRTNPTIVGVPGRAEQSKQPKIPVQKVLICAPSNAAIDEVTKRIVQGVRGSDGQPLSPKVVRVGNDSSINVSVKEASLDWLVTSKLEEQGNGNKTDGSAELNALRAQLNEVKEERQKKFDEIKAVVNNSLQVLALENEIKVLNAKRLALSQKLNDKRDEQKQQSRSVDAIRRQMRYEILADADIICSTLSGSGHEQLEPFDFGMIVIDEAAQSIELSSLIPLKYQCSQCIMVGDPQQLPPTVLSPEASKWGYDQSLFVRMMKQRPQAVHLLSIQYRMHPTISQLPSKVFYDGRLRDGPEMDVKTRQPWHNNPKFGVYKFYSVVQGREESTRVGHSLVNREEIKAVLALYDRIKNQYHDVDFDYRIGIVSMYRAQVQEFRIAFRSKYGRDINGKIDFNTVDGFQGQEKDIIILSCVRAGTTLNSIGFLADIRRMNVAITRSRSSLYIVGHGPTLERSNETWKGIIEDARSRQCFVELSSPYFVGGFKALPPKPILESVAPKAPKQKQITTIDSPEDVPPDLFSPKVVRKLPKGVISRKVIASQDSIKNGVSGKEQSVGEKRAFEGDQVKRLPPGERSNSTNDMGSSSTPAGSAMANGAPPMSAERAAKELEALKKRKKNANSMFIKR